MCLFLTQARHTCKAYAVLALLLFGAAETAARELKLITIEVAPWAFENPDTRVREGAFIELAREIGRRGGYDISISLTPFARVYRELESGGHDCTVLIPLSEAVVRHGEVVSHHDMGIVPHRDIPVRRYEQLRDLDISLLRGSAITERFDNDDSLHKVYDTDYLIALRKLSRGRTDAIAGAIPTIRYLAEAHGLDSYIGEPLKLGEVPLHLQCSLASDVLDILPDLNRIIREMKADGVVERIKEKYYF